MAAPSEASHSSHPPTTPTGPIGASTGGIPPLPEDATPEQKDQHWYKYVYQGDKMPQLTVRAVLMGGVLGMLMAAANLYTTLSIGWAFGIAITACVLSFVIWNLVILTSGKRVSQMSVLENACMASTASAAGYSTGSTIATMFGALVLLHDPEPGQALKDIKTWDVTLPWVVVIFTLCTGLMGVFLAIPMKRQMINQEQLPFPSGLAAAETLKSLYSASADAVRKAYVLVIGLGAGLVIGFLRAGDDILDAVAFLKRFFAWIGSHLFSIRIPAEIEIPIIGRLYPQFTGADGKTQHFFPVGFAFEPSALLIAAGMIVGMRISLSLVVSSVLLYAFVAPPLAQRDADVMTKPATTVFAAALNAGKAAPDAPSALAAAVASAKQAAAATGVDAEIVGKAAQAAGDGVLEAEAKARKDEEQAAKNEGKEFTPPVLTEKDKKAAAEAMAATVAGASAKKAGEFAANPNGPKASDEARAKALAEGKTEAEAEKIAGKAYENAPGRHRPNFIWNWGGGQVTITRWSLWGGTAVMVFASLTAVALQWKTLARAFRSVKGAGSDGPDLSHIEVPGTWMVLGMVPITIAMVWLQWQAFGVKWYAGVIAVAMSFVLSLVASRATGETDTTPIGAMGKVMQLMFAGLAPGNVSANLASAGIAANSASSSADLLTDLKTGYMLGANPRKQFLAQFFGVFFGTIAIVPIWYLMVPDRAALEKFALPSTRSWEAVARVLTKGVGELPESARWAILVGAGIGIVLPIIERLLPANLRKFMPSATGIGLAWVMPFQNAFSFLVGAIIALLWTRVGKKSCEAYNIPIASGLIAGESLMSAALAITATAIGLMHQAGWL